MTDTEILERLIYRAYIAPDPHAPLEAEALLPFQAALRLYVRTAFVEERRRDDEKFLEIFVSKGEPAPPDICDGDACPVDLSDAPEPAPASKDDRQKSPGPMTAESERPSPSPAVMRAKNVKSTRG